MNYARTTYEATLDIRYGQRFSELNQRFYDRLDLLFGGVQLVMGSAAASALYSHDGRFVAWAGGFLAAIAVLERLINAARKAESFSHARAAWGELDARAHELGLAELDSAIRRLQTTLPTGIGLLALPAYNANLRSHGHSAVKLSLFERAVALLA